jgi:hypothetical protein
MPIKVLDSDGWGTEFGLVDGIHDAAVHGANVINLSLSMAAPSAVVTQAIDDAVLHGVVVVAAAGNIGNAASTIPVSAPHTLAVAATDTVDTKAPCSCLRCLRRRQCPWGRHHQHLFCRCRRLVVLPSVREAQAPPQVRKRSVP